MDFGSALTFQFRDSRWLQKLLLVALLTLVPIIGQLVVLGWSLRITRRVIEGAAELLPEMDLVEDLVRGLKGWGISLIYSLPAFVLAFPVGTGLGLLIATDERRAAGVWILAMLCLIMLLIAYALLLAFVLPAAYAQCMAQDEQFSAGINLRAVFSLIRRGPVPFFLVFIGGVMCAFITVFGLVGCVIGVIFTSVYSSTVMAHLYGQAYLETKTVA